jgi:hypothetical protein
MVWKQHTAHGPERRTATRRQPALGTICQLATASGERLGVGLVWNISTGGVSMLLNDPLERGATLQAELRTVDNAVVLPLTLRVAHVLRLQTGDYVIGGQFGRPLAAEEMQPFLP